MKTGKIIGRRGRIRTSDLLVGSGRASKDNLATGRGVSPPLRMLGIDYAIGSWTWHPLGPRLASFCEGAPAPGSCRHDGLRTIRRRNSYRSEEHTSELQSLRHL